MSADYDPEPPEEKKRIADLRLERRPTEKTDDLGLERPPTK
jgi:hypothetical protein